MPKPTTMEELIEMMAALQRTIREQGENNAKIIKALTTNISALVKTNNELLATVKGLLKSESSGSKPSNEFDVLSEVAKRRAFEEELALQNEKALNVVLIGYSEQGPPVPLPEQDRSNVERNQDLAVLRDVVNAMGWNGEDISTCFRMGRHNGTNPRPLKVYCTNRGMKDRLLKVKTNELFDVDSNQKPPYFRADLTVNQRNSRSKALTVLNNVRDYHSHNGSNDLFLLRDNNNTKYTIVTRAGGSGPVKYYCDPFDDLELAKLGINTTPLVPSGEMNAGDRRQLRSTQK